MKAIFRIALQQPQALAVTDMRYQWNRHELTDYARRCAGRLIECGVRAQAIMWLSRCRKAQDNLLRFWPSCWPGRFTFRFRWISLPHGARKSTLTPASGWCSISSARRQRRVQTILPSLPGSRPLRRSQLPTRVVRAPTQPAYIIYTSGSTGTPKRGSHFSPGALNTCCDINTRYQVGPHDRCWPSPPYILIYRFTTFWRTARGRRAGDGDGKSTARSSRMV